jgi:hypothetical protein
MPALGQKQRSALLAQLLRDMERRNAHTGNRSIGEGALRVLGNVLQQKNIDKVMEEQAAAEKTNQKVLENALGQQMGGGQQSVFGPVRDESGNPVAATKDSQTAALAQALSRNPDNKILQMAAAQQMAPPDPIKPPQSRTRVEGEETIFEEWNPVTQAFEEVSRGPRKTPSTNVTVNSGALEPDLDKTVKKGLQETVLNSDVQLDLLHEIEAGFRPEFLQLKGQLKKSILETGEYLGKELSDQERQFVVDSTTFLSDTAENLNLYIKNISGAAVSAQEAERLAIAQPTADDSPTEYWAKLQGRIKKVNLARARANLALELGITDLGDVSNLSALNTKSFQRRLTAESVKWEQDLMRQGMTKEQAQSEVKAKIKRIITIGGRVVL